MLKKLLLITATIFSFNCGQALALDKDFFGFDYKFLLDGRVAYTEATKTWLDGGSGKGRYGGENRAVVRVGEISAILIPKFGFNTKAHIHLKYDPEQENVVDIVEAFFNFKQPKNETGYRVETMVGIFFPPVSLENIGVGWISPYSITPSAINSWVGEELKTIGAELIVHKEFLDDYEASLSGAGFFANDPAGTLLAFRGWALHDRKTGLFDQVPLALYPAIVPGGTFAIQNPYVEPTIHEIDGRIGYYTNFEVKHRDWGKLQFMYYFNRANQDAFTANSGQYAWRTHFINIGGHFFLPNQIELLAQFMTGKTKMGVVPAMTETAVENDFEAWYIMMSKKFSPRQRASLRYDNFQVRDKDTVLPDNNNNDSGWAIMGAYIIDTFEKQSLTIEGLMIKSNHPERPNIGVAAKQDEFIAQISYKIFI